MEEIVQDAEDRAVLRRVALPDEQIALVEDARLHHERQASDDRDALPREHGDVGR